VYEVTAGINRGEIFKINECSFGSHHLGLELKNSFMILIGTCLAAINVHLVE
jgi:hypothetical protein